MSFQLLGSWTQKLNNTLFRIRDLDVYRIQDVGSLNRATVEYISQLPCPRYIDKLLNRSDPLSRQQLDNLINWCLFPANICRK